MKSLLKKMPVNAFSMICMLTIATCLTFCNGGNGQYILIETDYGNMKVRLFDETPQHRDNFLKLVNEKYYDDLLFHRVINGFMIQGGDPNSRNASPETRLGMGGPGYTIPAEIGKHHFKGALAAARTSNPQKASSGSQFYIVQGQPVTEEQLNGLAQQKGMTYTAEQRKRYQEVGGTPQLDNEYTVFGEVFEGIEVIDKIAAVQTGQGDRPVKDVKMRIKLVD